ncbi:threonine/serine exporter family protein [Sediminitomix flava]|uniref:Uncharacterized membrane protein YjjP (DUF1212 family) n=1 Tax=Sediminitomix flava TaxID=379075 RepID=A0A315Z5P9_SEDFL|nr:threonine/serine exporter family protein [Sediminitomix flava]PWJ38529.1 uncharacterized membrane protein YjjP (DUF1212 family) [Sediminitomix flava]
MVKEKNKSDKRTNAQTYDFEKVCQFIKNVGKAAHQYGSTTMQLESYLTQLTTSFGYQGLFRATPTEILFSFRENTNSTDTIYIEPVPPTDFNLNKLSLLGKLVTDVNSKKLNLIEAERHLERIEDTPAPWGLKVIAISFVLAGAGFAMMLSGSLPDVLLSAVFSVVVLILQPLIAIYGGHRASDWSALLTALVIGVLAASSKIFFPVVNLITVTVSSLIILIPGFSISTGIIEMTSNHVVSGLANLMNGLLYLVKLFVGTWLGIYAVELVYTLPETIIAEPIAQTWLLLLLPPMMCALACIFQTAPKNFLAVVLISSSSLLGMVVGGIMLDANFGNLIGTILPVVFSNLWSRKTGEPSSIPLLPSIMLIVSGSIGFRGLATISTGQTALGEQYFIQMFIVAFTIGAGLLVGNTISRPNSSL